MHYDQYKQVALRHQAKLVTRGAHHRFGRVNILNASTGRSLALPYWWLGVSGTRGFGQLLFGDFAGSRRALQDNAS